MTERTLAWRKALQSGLIFGAVMGAVVSVQNSWLPPSTPAEWIALAAVVVLSGGSFAFFTGFFATSGIVPAAESLPLAEGEKIEHDGLANHFRNFEGRGGRLVLTNRQLVFTPHKFNLQKSEFRVARAEIAKAEKTQAIPYLSECLVVTLKSGARERFVVSDANAWAQVLKA